MSYDETHVEEWLHDYRCYRVNMARFVHWNDRLRRELQAPSEVSQPSSYEDSTASEDTDTSRHQCSLPLDVIRKIAVMLRPTPRQFQRIGLVDTLARVRSLEWQTFDTGVIEVRQHAVTGSGRASDFAWILEFDLSRRNLTGTLSPHLECWRELTSLQMWGNKLTGPLPSTVGTLPNLEILCLNHNRLTGNIPASLFSEQSAARKPDGGGGGGVHLHLELQLQNNCFSGSIPPSLGTSSPYLRHLNLSNNNLSGRIPEAIGGLKSLSHLELSFNKLTGPLPESFCALAVLDTCTLDDNQLCGPLPCQDDFLMKLPVLRRLDLRNNPPVQSDEQAVETIKAAVRKCLVHKRKVIVKIGAKRPSPDTGNFLAFSPESQTWHRKLPPPPPPSS